MSHTPGPWKYTGSAIVAPASLDTYGMTIENFRETFEHEPESMVVVSLISAMGGDDTTADAHLIATAPDLLEALKEIASADCIEDCGELVRVVEIARVAIAKTVCNI